MPIPSFTPGNVLTAAQLNTITAALPIVDAWTNYTPTLTQSATVTKTTTYARYIKVGRMVTVSMRLDVTGAGTAANAVVVGLPPFVPVMTSPLDLPMGTGYLFDASGGDQIPFHAVVASGSTFRLLDLANISGFVYLGATGSFAAGLVSGDSVSCTFSYESTT